MNYQITTTRVQELLNGCVTVNGVIEQMWDYYDGADVRGCKVQCIKRIREVSGLGLKESKDIFDAAYANPDYRWEGIQPRVIERTVEVPTVPAFLVTNVREDCKDVAVQLRGQVERLEAITRLLTQRASEQNGWATPRQIDALKYIGAAEEALRTAVYNLGDVQWASFEVPS